MKSMFVLSIFLITLTIPATNSAKILGFYCTPSPSHLIVHSSLIYELVRRGHEVTMVTTIQPTGKVPPALRLISLDIEHKEFNKMIADWLKPPAVDGDGGVQRNWYQKLYDRYNIMLNITDRYASMLTHPDFVRIKNESFDLVIIGWFMNGFQVGVAAHFKAPAIISLSSKVHGLVRSYVGNPVGVSHVPSMLLPYKDQMNFYQRVMNFGAAAMEHLLHWTTEYLIQQPYYEANFPIDRYPSYDEAKRNVRMILAAHHFSQGSIDGNLPGVVNVGGMHISAANLSRLPQPIREWLDGAVDGAIFFSLGSNAKSTQIPVLLLDGMLRKFSKLKQKVLMKWEDNEMPNKPANVLIGKWMPQSEILSHSNVKLFISHCGLGSVTEAKYHGVPILGLPIFADQPKNFESMVNDGWSIGAPLTDVTTESFSWYLDEMLGNESYGKVVKTASTLYRDRPQSGLETAVYWVEYVIRHNGAEHIQSPAVHLNFIQYHSLDVIGFICACFYVFGKVVQFLLCAVVRKCKGQPKTKRE